MCKLYIIIRTDIAQMNPGKAIAQGAHAVNLFERDIRTPQAKQLSPFYEEWCSDRGFGTTITLAATEDQMRDLMENNVGAVRGCVLDPTYPMLNHYGQPFTRPEVTAMYVFMVTESSQRDCDLLDELALYR